MRRRQHAQVIQGRRRRSYVLLSSFLRLAALYVLPLAVADTNAGATPISVIGTSYVSTRQHATATINVPNQTMSGDVIVVFIGGSGRPYKDAEPSGPIPETGWNEIIRFGPKDINQKAFYKVYNDSSDADDDSYTINKGKSIFASMVALRGVDGSMPIVDAVADGKDTLPGLRGQSRAPPVQAEVGGIVLASFAYDDPQVGASVVTPGFSTLVSFRAASGDGMAIGASSTTSDGSVGPIEAAGKYAKGAGEEVAVAVSFRSADVSAGRNSQSVSPTQTPTSEPPTSLPTSAPTEAPTIPPTSSSSLRGSADVRADDEKEDAALCGDGAILVPGMTFCYIKRDDDGAITRNDGKKCSFFSGGDTATRLKNHCNQHNLGALSCDSCARHVKQISMNMPSSVATVMHAFVKKMNSIINFTL